MKFTPNQLCEFYLDGNAEAAFTVFEHGGPQGLQGFLGFSGTKQEWTQLYSVLIDEYCFLDRLCQKYMPFMSGILFDRGVETFREVLHIEGPQFDLAVARVWGSLLDRKLESTSTQFFFGRRKSHLGTFFVGLRDLLRGELGEI